MNDLPAEIALRICSHMSPLMLNTVRTPTEGLLVSGFCDSSCLTLITFSLSNIYFYNIENRAVYETSPQQPFPRDFRVLRYNDLM